MAGANGVLKTGAGDHVVQFFRRDKELAAQADTYLAGALHGGSAVIVVATRAHRLAFEGQLADAGIDVTAAQARGDYLTADAQETVGRFMTGDRPDAARFDLVIGEMIRQATRDRRPVCAYGELVAVVRTRSGFTVTSPPDRIRCGSASATPGRCPLTRF